MESDNGVKREMGTWGEGRGAGRKVKGWEKRATVALLLFFLTSNITVCHRDLHNCLSCRIQ